MEMRPGGSSLPLVVAAVLAAAAAAVAAITGRTPRVSFVGPPRSSPSATALAPSLCPPGSLPDNGVCIPVPPPERAAPGVAATERIPRRPDRPPEYGRYALPVERVISVAELGDRVAPDGGALPSGIGLAVDPGVSVTALALEGQEGPARVAYEGALWGPTIVTLYTVRERGEPNRYVVALARLGSLKPRAAGDDVAPGAELGKTGASELIVETRLLRPGIDPRPLSAAALLSDASSAPTDPRNVLALK
jgi:hypothetical protein